MEYTFFSASLQLAEITHQFSPLPTKKKKTATAEKVGLKEEKKNEASERIW